jgi:SAM-dependent MidA family methyltransferase
MSSWLAEIVRSEGSRVSFERFMELALYHPLHGYYTSQIATIGRTGDFSTAISISDSLIGSIRSWIIAERKKLSMRRVEIIELGGGTGRLASGILQAFKPWESVRYQIVDVSRTLRQIQEHKLRGRPVVLTHASEAALRNANGCAILISNEFVDAFPCRRFVLTPQGWREIFLALHDDNVWREEYSQPCGPPPSSAVDVMFGIGQRIEVLHSYRAWLGRLLRLLTRGSILTIDYGGMPDEIYNRRPGGALRAFFRHQRIEGMGIYLRPGRQDLTADVNFVDVRSWGEEFGLQTVQLVTQAEFIQQWSTRKSGTRESGDQYVTDASGMGTAFKVLHQTRRG